MAVLDLDKMYSSDSLAMGLVNKFDEWESHKSKWTEQGKQRDTYLYGVSTDTTEVRDNDWKNSTTIPKLTQIYDNLVANYTAALFSTDDWLKWDGESEEDQEKEAIIVAYMKQKTQESDFETVQTNQVMDFVRTGNTMGTTKYVSESWLDGDGVKQIGYVGPRAVRLSPHDLVFDPTSADFNSTPKILRTITNLGQLQLDATNNPDDGWMMDVFDDLKEARYAVNNIARADSVKGHQYQMDGFNDITHYYGSGYIELLEFHGDLYDVEADVFYKNHIITVADRRKVVRKIPNPSWTGKSRIHHAGWRLRPDNLYAMGPLDNLVGMQYRMDHLENLKADAFDMIAWPMFKIKGQVEEFDYAPNERIIITSEDGDVDFMHPDPTALQADNQIAILEQRMEEMAGAPKQALGIRTPGEKTKFEVEQLQNASGRVFQAKISYYERHMMLPQLNDMLADARRNFNKADMVRTVDAEFADTIFTEITKEDIAARGSLRPVGSRHFAAQANLVQNLQAFFNSPLGVDPAVLNHLSGKMLAKVVFNDALDMARYNIYGENIRITEQFESQQSVDAGTNATGTTLPTNEDTGGTIPLGDPAT